MRIFRWTRLCEVDCDRRSRFCQQAGCNQPVAAIVSRSREHQNVFGSNFWHLGNQRFRHGLSRLLHHLGIGVPCGIGCLFNLNHLFNRDDFQQFRILALCYFSAGSSQTASRTSILIRLPAGLVTMRILTWALPMSYRIICYAQMHVNER